MRQQMRTWAGKPTAAEVGIAVGVVVLVVAVIAAVQTSRDAEALTLIQLVGVMAATALAVGVVLKVLTSVRRRRNR